MQRDKLQPAPSRERERVFLCRWRAWMRVPTGDCIDNAEHNGKVIEQYLTKQPRWSSDVIKALHQGVLLLGAGSRSFLLFFFSFFLFHTFGKQALTVWFNTVRTYLNSVSSPYRCIYHTLNKKQ